ncbi:hypothetical protein [Streptomyces anulatus]|uniref:hypothetical protein n=1 Tax=Streptomyces anulatus TaxID=1892 RepID=UPI00365ABA4E
MSVETMRPAEAEQQVVVQFAGDKLEQAAGGLLRDYREGLWIRRFAVNQTPCNRSWIIHPEHDRPVIDLSSDLPRLDWNAVSHLVTNTDSWVYRASESEVAVLQFAASLMGTDVSLQSIMNALDRSIRFYRDDNDEYGLELLQRALREAVAF